jgi:5-methyltetrahydropteroyltriglutamate--homocysteine methyltransferase
MTAASPGVISLFLANQYYPTHEAYLSALANAMKEEYDAIYQAGFLLQLDCPDLAIGMSGADEANVPLLRLHLHALNHAVRDIPPDRLRLHLCWGNYEGPHHRDVPLQKIIGEVLEARPVAVSFEGANPRHEHEWKVFEEIRLPEGKVIIPGVLDSTTNFIEHPELVAQRLERYASVVGREKVIAGTDCGFATFAGLLTSPLCLPSPTSISYTPKRARRCRSVLFQRSTWAVSPVSCSYSLTAFLFWPLPNNALLTHI